MTWRTRLILLGAIVVLFGITYALRNHGPHYRHGPDPFMHWLPLIMVGVFVVIFAIVFVQRMVINRRGMALLQQASSLAQQGRFLAALERVEGSRRHLGRAPGPAYYDGMLNLSLWRLEPALDALTRARKNRLQGSLRALVDPKLAVVQALRGRRDEAQALLATDPNHPESLLAQAIFDCRDEKWESAAFTLGRRELHSLGGMERGLHDALLAWTAAQLRGERKAFDRVALFGEAGSKGLEEVWPQLARFVASHGEGKVG